MLYVFTKVICVELDEETIFEMNYMTARFSNYYIGDIFKYLGWYLRMRLPVEIFFRVIGYLDFVYNGLNPIDL
uniref:Uncharacterized protein n=1 Tax=Panagrolaimus sp. JU765 TaxID=591449 RepID=A0AC34RH51_9BILA